MVTSQERRGNAATEWAKRSGPTNIAEKRAMAFSHRGMSE